MACCRLRMERHANRWKEWWAGLFSFFFFSRHYTLAPHSLTALAGSQKTLVLCALIYAPMQDIRSQWSKETNRFMSKANSNLLKNKKRSPIWWMGFPAPFFWEEASLTGKTDDPKSAGHTDLCRGSTACVWRRRPMSQEPLSNSYLNKPRQVSLSKTKAI